MSADELVASIQRDLDPNADISDAWADHDAERKAEDRATADRLGIDPKFIEAARKFGEDPEELAALDGAVTADDVRERMATLKATREAREQAEHERLVERVRQRLAG